MTTVTIETKRLRSALQKGYALIGGKSAIQILDCFLFDAREDGLRIVAANADKRMMEFVIKDAKIEGEPVKAAVPQTACALVQTIGDTETQFVLEPGRVTLRHGSGSVEMPAPDAATYPETDPGSGLESVSEVPLADIVSGLSRTMFACERKVGLRPVMQCISMRVSDSADGACFAATNSYVISVSGASRARNLEREVNIPFASAETLAKFLAKEDPGSAVRVTCYKGGLAGFTLESGDTFLCSTNTDAFPNWQRLLTENPKKITFDRKGMKSALTRMLTLFEVKNDMLADLSFGLLGCNVSTKDYVSGKTAMETIPCEGDAVDVSLNAVKLLGALDTEDSKDVTMGFIDNMHGVQLLDGDHVTIIMPAMKN